MRQRRIARVLVVCCDRRLSARLRRELEGQPDVDLEYVDAFEFARRSLAGTAADLILLDTRTPAHQKLDVDRVLRPRSVDYRGAHLHASLPGPHVVVDGRPVSLSLRESELLAVLLVHANRVVSRDALIAELWGYETRSLDVYIRRLRIKLGAAGTQIETVTRFGYRFADAAADVRVPASLAPTQVAEC